MTDRAASEVLSFALVFSLVISSVAIVSVGGLNSLQTARNAEQINNAERAFDVLADNVADISQRNAPSRATEINLEGTQLVAGDNRTINVTVIDASGDRTVVSRQVRPLIYEGGRDRRLIYEGAAMFRVNRDAGEVIGQPPVLVNGERAYVHVVALQSTNVESAGGSTVLVRKNERSSRLPVYDVDGDDARVYVNVTSPYADLWARTLDQTRLEPHESGTNAAGEEFVTYRVTGNRNVVVAVTEIGVSIEQ